jgi:outer membrane protein OmpA-like peptidoglycan-associated protein
MKRAMNVMELLQSKNQSAKFESYGVGKNVEIYDNNTPVGRMLSRTVQVYVITPKE